MRLFLLAAAALVIALAQVPAFAIPDAPASVWFAGNASPHYSNGTFYVNWTSVDNEEISNYAIYIVNSLTNATIRVLASTGQNTGLVFSGSNGINYTFKVSAVNIGGIPGPNATSDWIVVDTIPPVIRFVPPTPENKAYLRNATFTMILTSNEPLSSTLLKLNSTKEPANVTYRGWGAGTYYYYVDEQLPSEGVYSYSLWANDSAGNQATTETRTVTYDVTPPSVVIFSPQNVTYNTTRIYLNYTVQDMTAVSCWYSHNVTFMGLANCANATFTVPDNETYELALWALDSAGNANITMIDFFAKEIPPLPSPYISEEYPENSTALEPSAVTGSNITLISVRTDRVAECRYSFLPNTSFVNMTARFNRTNSTTHGSNITVSDNRSYTLHVRCRSAGGLANGNDYTFGFSVYPFFNALHLDSNESALDNGTLAIELVRQKNISVDIALTNGAHYDLVSLNYSIKGSGAPYLNITLPEFIGADSNGFIRLSAKAAAEGDFSADVTVTSGLHSANFSVILTVYGDYMPDLGSLRAARQNLFTRIYSLSSGGADVTDLMQESDRLQSDINDAYSMYNNGEYGAGRELYLAIKSDMNTLSESVADAEAVYAAESAVEEPAVDNMTLKPITEPDNGTAFDSEPDGGGEGTNLGAIIVAIALVVIVAAVLATSIVPDDEAQPHRQKRFLSEDA